MEFLFNKPSALLSFTIQETKAEACTVIFLFVEAGANSFPKE